MTALLIPLGERWRPETDSGLVIGLKKKKIAAKTRAVISIVQRIRFASDTPCFLSAFQRRLPAINPRQTQYAIISEQDKIKTCLSVMSKRITRVGTGPDNILTAKTTASLPRTRRISTMLLPFLQSNRVSKVQRKNQANKPINNIPPKTKPDCFNPSITCFRRGSMLTLNTENYSMLHVFRCLFQTLPPWPRLCAWPWIC